MLYLCPTPIGNLRDVTLRVIDTLGAVDVVACEDTRRTRALLAHHDLHPPRLISFHEHNEEAAVSTVLTLLREGRRVALVTDAGMPGLSDPGFRLVRACVDEGLAFTVLPGPSAVSTAVVASGLPTDRFVFVGFLPRGSKKVVAAVEEADRGGGSVVAFESPRRIRGTLAVVAERWPGRPTAVCRELTKLHEEVLRGTAAEVAALLSDPVKGEVVLVLGPAAPVGRGRVAGADATGSADALGGAGAFADGVDAALTRLLTAGVGTKVAAGVVADLCGLPAREVYDRALSLKERGA